MSPARELLDVEDDDARQQRIQTLLESTDASTSRPPHPNPNLNPLRPASRPHPLPPSTLLARAEAFLPRLAAANAALATADPATLDIETLPHDDAPHIELNLGLGVFEQRRRAASSASSSSSSSSSSSASSSTSEDSSDDSDTAPPEDKPDAAPPPQPPTNPDIDLPSPAPAPDPEAR